VRGRKNASQIDFSNGVIDHALAAYNQKGGIGKGGGRRGERKEGMISGGEKSRDWSNRLKIRNEGAEENRLGKLMGEIEIGSNRSGIREGVREDSILLGRRGPKLPAVEHSRPGKLRKGPGIRKGWPSKARKASSQKTVDSGVEDLEHRQKDRSQCHSRGGREIRGRGEPSQSRARESKTS